MGRTNGANGNHKVRLTLMKYVRWTFIDPGLKIQVQAGGQSGIVKPEYLGIDLRDLPEYGLGPWATLVQLICYVSTVISSPFLYSIAFQINSCLHTRIYGAAAKLKVIILA